MRAYGSLAQEVLNTLREFGPMTRADIAEHLKVDRYSTSAVVTRLSRAGARTPKRVYISGWVREIENERDYPRAIMALGDLPDVPPPRKRSRKEVRRKSDLKRKAKNTMNFVFNIGKPRREYTRKAEQCSDTCESSLNGLRTKAS